MLQTRSSGLQGQLDVLVAGSTGGFAEGIGALPVDRTGGVAGIIHVELCHPRLEACLSRGSQLVDGHVAWWMHRAGEFDQQKRIRPRAIYIPRRERESSENLESQLGSPRPQASI